MSSGHVTRYQKRVECQYRGAQGKCPAAGTQLVGLLVAEREVANITLCEEHFNYYLSDPVGFQRDMNTSLERLLEG